MEGEGAGAGSAKRLCNRLSLLRPPGLAFSNSSLSSFHSLFHHTLDEISSPSSIFKSRRQKMLDGVWVGLRRPLRLTILPQALAFRHPLATRTTRHHHHHTKPLTIEIARSPRGSPLWRHPPPHRSPSSSPSRRFPSLQTAPKPSGTRFKSTPSCRCASPFIDHAPVRSDCASWAAKA